jgi:putative inorganic carbon (hco3(-)) transporter
VLDPAGTPSVSRSNGLQSLERWIGWYDKALIVCLLVSVSLVGLGRFAFFSEAIRISAWSISRTAFIFWLAGKIVKTVRGGGLQLDFVRHPVPLSLIVFFLTVAVSLLPDFRAAGDFGYFLFGCMHALMIMDLFKTRAHVRWLVLLLALSPALVTLRGILNDPSLLSIDQMQHLGFPLQRRLGFPLDHPNTAGYLFSMSIPLAAALVLAERGWLRWLGAASCAAQVAGLILTYSRGAWLGWGAAMLFLLALTKRWKALLGVLMVPLLLVIFLEPLRSRALSVTNPSVDPAIRDRMRFMGDTLELGYNNPLGGIGYGRGRLKEALRHTYKGTVDENSPIWHAHNVYIELFAETGLMGLGAFLWLLGRAHFEMLRLANRSHGGERIWVLGLAAGWIAAAVTGFGDVPFYHHETRIFFFTLLALAFATANVSNLSASSK